jgi:hypothetical protein
MQLRHAQEVRLTKRHTLLPHNVVGGGDVEVEVRNAPVRDVDQSTELELLVGHLHRDLKSLFALEGLLLALGLAQQLESLLDAVLQLCCGGLVVLDGDPFGTGDAVKHALSNVAGELDLEGEGKHVLCKPGLGEVVKRDVVLVCP